MATLATAVAIDPRRFPLLLYKAILRLHRGLPLEMREIGDRYVRDEFRRHRAVDRERAMVFLKEWTQYCVTLSRQLSQSGIAQGVIGSHLQPERLEELAEQQIRQLYELKLEAEKKPS